MYEPGLAEAIAKGIYTAIVVSDILQFLKRKESEAFDVVVASCVIEHMPRALGHQLAREMARVARSIADIHETSTRPTLRYLRFTAQSRHWCDPGLIELVFMRR